MKTNIIADIIVALDKALVSRGVTHYKASVDSGLRQEVLGKMIRSSNSVISGEASRIEGSIDSLSRYIEYAIRVAPDIVTRVLYNGCIIASRN